MCGLFGSVSSFLTKEELQFTNGLGLLSSFRGVDSTGLAVLSKDNKKYVYGIRKRVEPSGFFLNTQSTADWMDSHKSPMLVMGHCRAATLGSITQDNAHPFHINDIIGVHNGTIANFADNNEKTEARKTDSQLFYEMLAAEGLEAALEKAYKDNKPCAYAFVWLDLKRLTLNVIRNDQRSLWFMPNSNATTHYWASEQNFLAFMRNRSNSNFRDPFSVEQDVLHTLSLYTNKWVSEKVNIKKTRPFIPIVHNYNHYDHHGSGTRGLYASMDDWWDDQGEVGTVISPKKALSKNEQKRLKKARAEAIARELSKSSNNVVVLDTNKKIKDLKDIKWPKPDAPANSDLISIAFLTEDDKDYLYIGFNQTKYEIKGAKSMLDANAGCFSCTNKADVNTKIFWKNHTDYLCNQCFKSGLIKELEGPAYHDYQPARLVLKKLDLFK